MTLSIGGRDVGYTKGGVEMEVSTEYYEVEMDQSLTSVKRKLIGRDVTVRTTLGESTLENLRDAFNLADSALVSSSLEIDLSEKGEVEIVFTGKGPNDCTRTATFFAAVIAMTGPTPYLKDGETVIPVEFQCNYDDTEEALGTIVDTAA